MIESLGERMKKNYESRCRYFLPRRTYTIIRIDGKAFHTFTKSFEKPFDEKLNKAFIETTKEVANKMQGFQFAYHQSDEVSFLLTDFEKEGTEAWFDGNIQKICSVSASSFTNNFKEYAEYDDIWDVEFDSRCFTIPDRTEVMNYFIWRQQDCIRNSISMLAQSKFSHKQLEGKNGKEMQEMMFQLDGTNWSELAENYKNGTLFFRGISDWDKDKIHSNPAPKFDCAYLSGWIHASI